MSVLARDLEMYPYRKYLRSAHFKVCNDEKAVLKLRTCSQDEEDSVQLDPYKIDPEMMLIEPISKV